MRSSTPTERRTFLKTIAAVSIAGPLLAGCASSGAGNNGDGSSPADNGGASATSNSAGSESTNDSASTFGNWFENTTNYDNVVDKTSTSKVTVKVGAEGNNGPYAFAPPAIRIGPGTTIMWKWTGEGGSHNVVEQDGSFESKLSAKKGYTFEYTFKNKGTYKYFCSPHKAMGMKGVVVIK